MLWESGKYNESISVGEKLVDQLEEHDVPRERARPIWHLAATSVLSERMVWLGTDDTTFLSVARLADKWSRSFVQQHEEEASEMATNTMVELIDVLFRMARVWKIRSNSNGSEKKRNRNLAAAERYVLHARPWVQGDQRLRMQAAIRATRSLFRQESHALLQSRRVVTASPRLDYTIEDQAHRWQQKVGGSGEWGGDAKPAAPHRCDLDRRQSSQINADRFFQEYVVPGKPVLVDELLDQWPARTKWTRSQLLKLHGHRTVELSRSGDSIVTENVYSGNLLDRLLSEMQHLLGKQRVVSATRSINISQYLDLLDHDASNASDQTSRRALYLFKKRNPLIEHLSSDFVPITYFHQRNNGIFDYPVDRRATNAIFYLGPQGSGTGFHVHSAAYNALIYGRKRWFLLPPRVPAVKDNSEGAWSEKLSDQNLNRLPVRPLVCDQMAGETLYVPEGWQHAVVNIEPSIGIAVEIGSDVPFHER